ncbi:MAG: hypothetical protein DMG72_23450 [Acidobacteria bacterium]|nr:MAG: hypothetical protein DMG72_23450 [Acidobacteriota bacterium]
MEFDATMAAVDHKGSYAIACGISKFRVESTRSRVVDHSALNPSLNFSGESSIREKRLSH